MCENKRSLKNACSKTTQLSQNPLSNYATVLKSSVPLRNCLQKQCGTTQLSPKSWWYYTTVTNKWCLFGGGPLPSKWGKRSGGCIGPRARRLYSYIAPLACCRVASVACMAMLLCYYVAVWARLLHVWCLCCLHDGILAPSWSMLAPNWCVFGTK